MSSKTKIKEVTTEEVMHIVECAHKLEDYLSKNSGLTADWPIRIKVDDVEVANTLSELMTNLHQSLKVVRS